MDHGSWLKPVCLHISYKAAVAEAAAAAVVVSAKAAAAANGTEII